jgi:hypothetical protein
VTREIVSALSTTRCGASERELELGPLGLVEKLFDCVFSNVLKCQRRLLLTGDPFQAVVVLGVKRYRKPLAF